jgi:hypothetical protein
MYNNKINDLIKREVDVSKLSKQSKQKTIINFHILD